MNYLNDESPQMIGKRDFNIRIALFLGAALFYALDIGWVGLIFLTLGVASFFQHMTTVIRLKAINSVLSQVDVFRHGYRIKGADAIAVRTTNGAPSHSPHYQNLTQVARTSDGMWFLVRFQVRSLVPRAEITEIQLADDADIKLRLQDEPHLYEKWFAGERSAPIAGNTSPGHELFEGSSIRTFVCSNESWKDSAYPLKLITVQAQGTRHTERSALIGALEDALDRLRAGDIAGEHSDDDYGYRFEVAENMPVTIFADPASQSETGDHPIAQA